MPTYTTITENQDGTYSLTVHDADALRRVQTMCDVIREDDDPTDTERAAVAAYAGDLYRIIDDALAALVDREEGLTECCGASLTGTDDGMACRSCYQIVSPIV